MSQAKMKTITITPDPKSFPSLEPAFVLPLTTTFTPPCYSYVRVADGPSLCGPPDMVSVWGNRGYYSPGLCPEGYSAGCSINAPGTNDWRPYPLASGETAVSCVPSGFTCITWTVGEDAFSVDNGAFTYAPAFEVRWKSSDLAIFASAASSSGSSRHSVTTAGPTATSSGSTGTGMTTAATAATTIPLLSSLPALTGPATTTTPTPAPTPASSVQPSSGGIGVGALTGAIVGGAALVLGAFLAGYFYRRSKKTKAAAQAQNAHVESWISSGPGGDGSAPGGAPAGMNAGSGGQQQQQTGSAAEKTTSAPTPSLHGGHGGHVEIAGCEVPALHRQSSFVPAASQQQHHQTGYEVSVAAQRQSGQQDPAGGQHQMPIPSSMSTSNLSIGGAGPANRMYLPYRPASFSTTPGAAAELPTSFIAELPADSVPSRQ